MKIARILTDQQKVHTVVIKEDGRLERCTGSPCTGLYPTGEQVQAHSWLPPVEPAAILCIGLNYRHHAEECGNPIPDFPVLFMKNVSAATGHMQPIVIPAVCADEVDFECELAVVIGRACRDVKRDEAFGYVLGYTAANDVTARLWQGRHGGSQWCRGKGFDTFAPLGPVLVTPDQIPNPNALAITTRLNGVVMQQSHTSDMIFNVAALIEFLSQGTTLVPGTVILTGTPEGIGWARRPRCTLKAGDIVEVTIEGIGTLQNPVTRE